MMGAIKRMACKQLLLQVVTGVGGEMRLVPKRPVATEM